MQPVRLVPAGLWFSQSLAGCNAGVLCGPCVIRSRPSMRFLMFSVSGAHVFFGLGHTGRYSNFRRAQARAFFPRETKRGQADIFWFPQFSQVCMRRLRNARTRAHIRVHESSECARLNKSPSCGCARSKHVCVRLCFEICLIIGGGDVGTVT